MFSRAAANMRLLGQLRFFFSEENGSSVFLFLNQRIKQPIGLGEPGPCDLHVPGEPRQSDSIRKPWFLRAKPQSLAGDSVWLASLDRILGLQKETSDGAWFTFCSQLRSTPPFSPSCRELLKYLREFGGSWRGSGRVKGSHRIAWLAWAMAAKNFSGS